MKKFALLTNFSKDPDLVVTNQVADYIHNKGREYWMPHDQNMDDEQEKHFDLTDMPEDIDCVLVLGGDGTLLQAARDLQKRKIPVFGINMGTLGFLTSIEKSELPDCLDDLFEGRYVIEDRMMLKGIVYHNNEIIMESLALNDIIVSRAGLSRLVEVKIFVNDELMTIYGADGVIVSTPTGSTGYNLSAGGPIVFPETEAMIITPICPHSLQARSIVVSGADTIKVVIGRRRKTQNEDALVTFDGKVAKEVETDDYIRICKAQEITQLVRLYGKGFYQIIQNKIGGV